MVAVLISWVWWVTFIISLIAMSLIQVIWCCRQNRCGFLALILVSSSAAIMSFFSAIWMAVVWRNATWCVPFYWWTDDYNDDYNFDDYGGSYASYDNCNEGAWAAVAFVNTALWLAVTGCLLYFEFSGLHAKWENRISGRNGTTTDETSDKNHNGAAVELGIVRDGGEQVVVSTKAGAEDIPKAAAVLESDSYVPPEIPAKVR